MKAIFLAALAVFLLAPAVPVEAVQPHPNSRLVHGRECFNVFNDTECARQTNADELQTTVDIADDVINGASRQLVAARRADSMKMASDALATLERFSRNVENDFSRYPTPSAQEVGRDVMTSSLRPIQADFERNGWPIPATISGAYRWASSELSQPYTPHKQAILNWAEISVPYLMGSRLSYYAELRKPQGVHAARVADGVSSDRAQVGSRKLAGNSYLVAAPNRAWEAIKGTFWVLLVAMAIGGYAMKRGTSKLAVFKGIWSAVIGNLVFQVPVVVLGALLPDWGMWIWLGVYLVVALVVYLLFPWERAAKKIMGTFRRFKLPESLALGWGIIEATGTPSTITTHGSARWGDLKDATAMGHLLPKGNVLADSHGFALGRMAGDQKWQASMDTRFRYMGHTLTVAQTGAGKGVGAVIPNLLEYPGSAIVIDIKGENYAVTARFRRERLGHDVYLVDPFGDTGEPSHRFNWLDRINPDDEDVVGEAEALADMLVMTGAKSSDSGDHFNEKARSLLKALIIQAACNNDPRKRNLGEIRRVLMGSIDEWNDLLTHMALNTRGFGIPTREANALSRMADREREGVISTVQRHTGFLDDPRIQRSLAESDFSLDDIKTKPMTVYLVIPPKRLETNARFLRGFIHQAITAVTDSEKSKGRYKVAFFLDEFAQLGYIPSIEKAVSLLRGYGLVFWFFLQNLEQIKVYPQWASFLSACAKQVFGTNDGETAQWVTDQLGKATLEYHTKGASQSSGLDLRSGSNSGSDNQQFIGRELLTKDEVQRMSPKTPILLLPGEPPYQVDRLTYYDDAEYAGLYDVNPYEKPAELVEETA